MHSPKMFNMKVKMDPAKIQLRDRHFWGFRSAALRHQLDPAIRIKGRGTPEGVRFGLPVSGPYRFVA